ncbi:glutathione S-transferase [Dichotomopilus funicola]|uniref:Glutathione S-transferase n=1 Tax=Dichotomopilus funicola TaxID=1934379 RepID=A0AAN6UVG0_9PEZI|nr:glutathione S-transferase [Dichotomopilus funicola]
MSFGTIYTHNPTPRTTAILAIAKLHGLQLDVVFADKQDTENYAKLLEINPLGQVPTFVGADGFVLTECIPITLYLASQSKTTTLLGATRHDEFLILKWMSLLNSNTLPAAAGVILPLTGVPLAVRKNVQDCLRAFYKDCRLLEDHLSSSDATSAGAGARKYFVGEQLTVADLFAAGVVQFVATVFHRVLKAEYPRLWEWFCRVYETPVFREVAGELVLLDLPVPELE